MYCTYQHLLLTIDFSDITRVQSNTYTKNQQALYVLLTLHIKSFILFTLI